MNRLSACRLLPVTLILVVLLVSCANDIDLFRQDQEKEYVVFGLLNSSDPLQQVKVRLTSISDAPLEELITDSSEFSAPENLQVMVQEWYNQDYAIYNLEPVDYEKEPGVFFNTRNTIYESRFNPDMDMEYKLIISNPDSGDLITSKIVPVPAPILGAPSWPWIHYSFSYDADPFNIRFKEVPRVYVYLIRFTIRYLEVGFGNDSVIRENSYVFKPRYSNDPPEYEATRENSGNEHNRSMTKIYTYNVMRISIPDRDQVLYRQLICFKVSVWGGDQNLRNYIELGTKFTDNRRYMFSNINNGIGVFGACSYSACDGVLPDQAFLDSLPLNTRTASLKFRTELYKERQSGMSFRPDNATDQDFIDIIKEIGNE
ncbi:MAG: hypothetical protein V2A67_07345 [Bacteroidota bacterium]